MPGLIRRNWARVHASTIYSFLFVQKSTVGKDALKLAMWLKRWLTTPLFVIPFLVMLAVPQAKPDKVIVHPEPFISLASVSPMDLITKDPKLPQASEVALPAPVIAAFGTYGNNYAAYNCTEYVASKIKVPNSMGNASNWDDYARSIGVPVSTIPRVGAVAQSDWMSPMGHVAVLEAVNADGTVTISEENYFGLGVVDTRVTLVSDWVYIYF